MSQRNYLVSLPVAITVTDEGKVTYSVDISEAESAVRDETFGSGRNYDEVHDDARAVGEDYDRRSRGWVNVL